MNQGRVYWFERTRAVPAPPARGAISADAVVVGGGIAGLTAARCLAEAGRDVVLLEADFCGSGATGRSSGFLTPDSELELAQLERRFGPEDAAHLWREAQGACDAILADVEAGKIDCDLVRADAFYVARSERAAADVRAEHEAHARLGFASRLYDRSTIGEALGAEGFHAGARAGGTFGIDAFAYARHLAASLAARGVRVFERSPVVRVARGEVATPEATVTAPKIVLCLDRFALDLGIAPRDVWHAEALLALTEPLDPATLGRMFPSGPLLVWDTDLVYHYLRPTAEGRLLVGGGRLRETFAKRPRPGRASFETLERYARERFPFLGGARFTHAWSGLIGLTKDLLPLAGRSTLERSHWIALCGAGIPWSAVAARCAATQALGGSTALDRFFSPGRGFPFESLQPMLPRSAMWAWSYYYNKNLRGREA
jgi:gamma-glutamylputrescine oxidase